MGMLDIEILEDEGIAVVRPNGQLSKRDFEIAAERVDPFIERTGGLRGLLIHVESFPGWDSFAALVTHFQFVQDHHQNIARIALVTDAKVGALAETVVRHFVHAEIKHFEFSQFTDAKHWIQQPDG